MNNKKNRWLLFVLLFSVTLPIFAQNGINSPFSQFGVGELKTHYFHPYINSMGGLSYTIRKNNVINTNNPASYAAIDSNSFVFDMGLGADFITLQNNSQSLYDADAALSHIMLGFPLAKWWKTSFGIQPYSEVSYITTKNTYTLGNGDSLFAQSIYDGTGGVTKLYWGHAFKIADNFSVGFNANYLFGQETRAMTFLFPDSAFMLNSRRLKVTQISNFTFDFGLQYYYSLNENYTLGLGLTYSMPMNLKVKDNSVIYTFVQKGYMEYARDTILPSAEYESTLEMPMVVGMGLSLVRNEKWLVGVDATYSSWSMPKYTENPEINVLGKWTAFDYTESLRFSLGGEKMADMFSSKYFERMSFRAGLHFEQGKLSVLNQQTGAFETLNDFGIHAGMSFPVRKMKSVINLTVQWGTYGVKEILNKNYVQIGLSLSTSDTWFKKRKYD
ncbi:MAG: hypothetical protein IKY22_00450 [Bacteroidales bacterium]|nr:hypothetical protein [Bacteroidales bacterium]